MHAFPPWTHPGKSGCKVGLRVISNAQRIEVVINGKTVAKAAMVNNEATLSEDIALTYVPGTLAIKAFSNDKLVAQYTSNTSVGAEKLKLMLPRSTIKADGVDTLVARAQIADSEGAPYPFSSRNLKFEVLSGPGRIIGVGNGDPSASQCGRGTSIHAFRGWAIAHIQSGRADGHPLEGAINLRVSGEGLQDATAEIRAVAEGEDDPVLVYTEDETGGTHASYSW